MKKITSIIVALLILALFFVSCGSHNAEKLNSSSGLAYIIDQEENRVIIIGRGTCPDLHIVIPESIDGYPVTEIANAAFANDIMKSVTIPASVTSVGEDAFYNCTCLTRVYITDIAKWCAISFGDNPLCYAHNLYLNGELVTDLVIPSSVTSIKDYAFYCCETLMSITIPESVTSIGECAFYCCHHLVEVRNLSSLSITAGSYDCGDIGHYAKHIYKDGESYLYITNDGFVFYDDGTEVYLIGYSGTKTELALPETYNGKSYVINRYAFRDCTFLTSVIIGNNVTSVGYNAFSRCTSLTSVRVGENSQLTSIEDSAFFGCKSLKSITISASLTSIEGYAFYCCESLTSIAYQDTKAQWNAISKEADWDCDAGNYVIHCTDGDIAK